MNRYLMLTILLLLLLPGCQSHPEHLESPLVAATDSPYAVRIEDHTAVVDANLICTAQEGASQEIADAVNTQLLSTPRWLREFFIKSGWSMQVVPYDIATEDYPDKFEPGAVLASTAYKAKLIKVLNERNAAANAPIHELGHWLDSILGYPTLNDVEYQRIYEAEGQSYRNTFGPSCSWDNQEFFAEGFWCYWKSPSSLRKACPQFYGYLKDCLLEVQEQCHRVNDLSGK